MAKTGRPKFIIDWADFDKLCHLQCSLREISAWLDCSEDTIERRVKEDKGMSFADYFDIKRGKGRVSLRRKQYDVAMSGSVPMLIFLGKQYLNQKDKQEIEQTSHHNISPVDLKELADMLKDE